MKKAYIIIVPFLILALTMFNLFQPGDSVNSATLISPSPEIEPLPVIGDEANFKKLLAESEQTRGYLPMRAMTLGGGVMMEKSMAAADSVQKNEAAAAPMADTALGVSDSDFSGTNLQVRGVDEADIIKTDGKYIYQLTNSFKRDPYNNFGSQVIISQVYPADEMKVVKTINFAQEEFMPREMYVDNEFLVLIGSTYHKEPLPNKPMPTEPLPTETMPAQPLPESGNVLPKKRAEIGIYPPVYHRNMTKILIYELKDRVDLEKTREMEVEGDYISSRKVGSALYLVTNKYIDYYRILKEGIEPAKPSFYDSVGQKKGLIEIDYKDIRYFPGTVEPNYLMVAGLDLKQPTKEMQVTAYLGSGQSIYASTSNLYVAVPQYKVDETAENKRTEVEIDLPAAEPQKNSVDTPAVIAKAAPAVAPDMTVKSTDEQSVSVKEELPKKIAPDAPVSSPGIIGPMPLPMPVVNINTAVYKFGLNQGVTEYKGKGEVLGNILNQFSMDEYKGDFRIATTSGEMWRTGDGTSKNNLYILDQSLNLKGKLEGLAPGEKIYSVRFMGDRAYMVTFKSVDPLFVLDLKDPVSPQVLGELKIPGYSDYLHPYDENHLIGIGKETVELTLPQSGAEYVPRTTAFYLGMKIALFDVTDVSNPVEMFKETIGDRGTDSEILHNHKAFLFDKEKNLLALPVNLFEVKSNKGQQNYPPEYGKFVFQGAYVYNLDLEKGFTLKGRISHLPEQEYAQEPWEKRDSFIERVLYIGDTLYTVSPKMIKANELFTLQEKASLDLD